MHQTTANEVQLAAAEAAAAAICDVLSLVLGRRNTTSPGTARTHAPPLPVWISADSNYPHLSTLLISIYISMYVSSLSIFYVSILCVYVQ